jgi:hypothetical protein
MPLSVTDGGDLIHLGDTVASPATYTWTPWAGCSCPLTDREKTMRKSALVLAVLFLSGCATQTYNIHGGNSSNIKKEDMQHFFISGLGQEKDMDAAQICGGADKVAMVQSHLTFLDGFLGTVTFGIYTPRSARVYCTG